MGYILIVHAKDVSFIVEPIARTLRELDIDCLTTKEKLKTVRLGSQVTKELEKMVESATSVLVFASPGLLYDYTALTLLDYASTQGNLLAFTLSGFSAFSIPKSFYRAFSILDLGPGTGNQVNQIVSAIFSQFQPHF